MDREADLRSAALLGAEAATEGAMRATGVLCGGCGRAAWTAGDAWEGPWAKNGWCWEYLFLQPGVRDDGGVKVRAERRWACGRGDCTWADELRKEGAVARRRIPAWEILEAKV